MQPINVKLALIWISIVWLVVLPQSVLIVAITRLEEFHKEVPVSVNQQLSKTHKKSVNNVHKLLLDVNYATTPKSVQNVTSILIGHKVMMENVSALIITIATMIHVTSVKSMDANIAMMTTSVNNVMLIENLFWTILNVFVMMGLNLLIKRVFVFVWRSILGLGISVGYVRRWLTIARLVLRKKYALRAAQKISKLILLASVNVSMNMPMLMGHNVWIVPKDAKNVIMQIFAPSVKVVMIVMAIIAKKAVLMPLSLFSLSLGLLPLQLEVNIFLFSLCHY